MFEKVKESFEKRNFCFDENATDFTDFSGVVLNNKKEPFEVTGSIEIAENTLSYSVVFYDVNNNIEYDGIIGSFVDICNDTNIDELIEKIVTPNFVVI